MPSLGSAPPRRLHACGAPRVPREAYTPRAPVIAHTHGGPDALSRRPRERVQIASVLRAFLLKYSCKKYQNRKFLALRERPQASP